MPGRKSELGDLDYDRATGIFSWNKSVSNKPSGRVAGAVRPNGYICVSVGGRKWYAHRLAWFLVYGEEPQGQIDHINGDRADNRISNLRVVTCSENLENQRRPRSNNSSGFLGVVRKGNRWGARITKAGVVHSLGWFGSPEEARLAYLAAKKTMHIAQYDGGFM